MISKISIVKSKRKNKKWRAIIETNDGEKVNVDFGDDRYDDFTQHKDKARRERYLIRHKGEDWTSKDAWRKPAYWSRWILWENPSIKQAILNVKKKLM